MKTVEAVVEVGPNYIFHLMAVARNGFDSDYAARYRDTVNAADLSALEDHRRDLVFRDGGSGLSHGRDPSLAYKTYENLARYYNSLVLRSAELYPMSPFYDADTFFGIFESIHRSRPSISPLELALEGMERYTSMSRM